MSLHPTGRYAFGEMKITIMQETIPGDGNQGTTHQPVDRARVETRYEPVQVSIVISGLHQPLAKSSQWHIGERIQVVEDNPPSPSQVRPEFRLRSALSHREKRARGVAYEAEFQAGTGLTVPQFVEHLERVEGLLEHPATALGFQLSGV